jgi:hypothetical protein
MSGILPGVSVNSLPLICRLLIVLKLHRQDCVRCSVSETRGTEMVKRLEELSWRTQEKKRSKDNGDDSMAG